jgi:Predicted RNA methylase
MLIPSKFAQDLKLSPLKKTIIIIHLIILEIIKQLSINDEKYKKYQLYQKMIRFSISEDILFLHAHSVPLTMKKKDLEIALEKVPAFLDPDPILEQYPTPASIAADILFDAYRQGDVKDLKVMDLGCGTGIFSIGAWLLGAGITVGYDVSEKALEVANDYSRSVGADIEYKLSDINDISEGADTVFMNPPFGCQTRRADRDFLSKAMESSECIYSIHMAETLDFVERYVEERGRKVTFNKMYKYNIPNTFSFHSKEKHSVDIVMVNIR